jgi:hypothetical protein
MNETSLILDTVHAFYYGNPLCIRTITPTRKWQRFCSDECRQAASIIKRAGELLMGLSDEALLKIIRGERS